MSHRLLAVCGAALAAALPAQSPTLVADIRPGFVNPPSTNARGFVTAGGQVFFVADDVVAGPSLFVTDGTATGTRRLRAFVGNGETVIQWATPVGNELWFLANDGVTGPEPWRSDGTVAGTVQVADCEPGATGSFPERFLDIGGRVVFFCTTSLHGHEPWTSQGTPATTALLFETQPGTSGGLTTTAINYGGVAMFDANDGSGTEVWVSDGTTAGTMSLDVNPTGACNPKWLCAAVLPIGFRVVFSATRPGSGGQELFVSDGTPTGTQQIVDLPGDANPNFLTWHGQHVYFAANSTGGIELWRTDGTAAGTVQVVDAEPGNAGSFPSDLISCGSNLYFTATTAANGKEPWVTQGLGATLLADIRPGPAWSTPLQFTRRGNDVFFRANAAGSGNELWLGTATGAQLVRDIHPNGNAFGAVLTTFAELSGTLYFGADDGVAGREPWRSDGTFAGTSLVIDLAPGTGLPVSSFPDQLLADTQQVLFTADDGSNGRELWRTDGTMTGTALVADVRPGSGSSLPMEIVRAGPSVFFTADDGSSGREPWVFDGVGTTQFDLAPGATSSNPSELIDWRGRVALVAESPTTGREVWTWDGTPAGGTVLDVIGGPVGSDPVSLVALGRYLCFAANAGVAGRELFAFDGTLTTLLDLEPGLPGSSPDHLAVLGDRLLFAATSAANGRELWISDLTPAGTFRLADLNVGPASSSPSAITPVGGRAFFVADDGVTGNELWVTDGIGTFLVADIEAGSGSSNPVSLTPFRGGVLFLATTTTSGREMWWSDGSAAGTVLLVDSVPGGGAGDISAPIVSGSRFAYFSSGVFGNPVTLYRTDGTAANTTVAVAGGSLAPMVPLGVFGNDLMLFAGDGVTGVELWSVDVGATAQSLGVPCAGARGGPRLAVPDPVLGTFVSADASNLVNGTFAFLMLGLPATTPFSVLGSDCWLQMEPGTISSTGLVPVAAGSATFSVPVPNLTALVGLRFVLQAAATPSPAPWGWDVTNGVVVTIGS